MLSLNLTVAEFCASTREVLLVHRQGRIDEEPLNHRAVKNDVYQALGQGLTAMGRSLEKANATFSLGSSRLRLRLARFYHHEGFLYRIVDLQEGADDPRPTGPTASEVDIMQIGGLVSSLFFRQRHRGLRVRYRQISKDPLAANPILKTWTEVLEEETYEQRSLRVEERFAAILLADGLPDENLPDCNLSERHGSTRNPWRKCADFCRARHVCSQFKHAQGELERCFGGLGVTGAIV